LKRKYVGENMKNKSYPTGKLAPLFIFLTLAIVLLSACGGTEAEPTAAPEAEQPPTEAPATEAPPTEVPPTEAPVVEESSSVLDTFDFTPDPRLIDKTWAWERRDPSGNDIPAIEVPNPENYTIVFNEDGTFAAEIDCNDANGMYATEGIENPQSRIYMELGPMTSAFCGEESLDQDMINMFGPAQSYEFLEDGEVVKFAWAGAGPVDYFRNVSSIELPDGEEGEAIGTVTAPDGVFLRTGPGTDYPYVGAAPFEEQGEIIGVSEDTLWWQADAPNLPEDSVWVTAEWVEVTNGEKVPVVAAPPLEPTLTNVPWEWVSTTDPAQGTVAVNDPSRYVILFNDDGTAYIRADCNTVQTTYTTDGSSISITQGITTLAACPPDSLDSQFLAQLANAAIYFIEGGNLYIDQAADSGTMRFVPQGTPPPAEDAPAGEGDGSTFYLVSYGAEGAEQAVIEGTQITASFADDLITGNAGCNNYSGTLTEVNDYFTVGDMVTTRQFCAEPAGVMDQEQAYLTALGSIAGYRWEQTRRNDGTLVTEGQLFYTMADGTVGVLNFSTSP
jgi:heat shock protein HslJ